MSAFRVLPPAATAALAFAALVLACAFVVQNSGPNQAAHHALVRALASGTAEIDPRETIDAAYVDGRFYAAKAPGLAMLSLPWHGALRVVGLQDSPLGTEAGYRERVWELNLFGAVLPLALLLLLMAGVVERVVPGFGTPTAVLLGAGTLLLPFATLFFDHVLSATLGFAAFTVLFGERRRSGPSPWMLAAGGVLAGLAVVVEFPLGIVAIVLAAYAAAGERRLRRALAYVAGVAVGALPLLAYNAWAFGSPARLGYTNALKAPAGQGAAPVVGANDSGFYGVGLPDPRAALSLLVSQKGLLVVTPLAIAALFGLPRLRRSGARAEAWVCAAIPLLFLAYNAAYYLPYGGQSPGPRFLVPAIPFLALPLAFLLRARPLVVAGVAVASAVVMTLATLTGPLTGVEYGIDTWFDRLTGGRFVETVADRLGLTSGWASVLPVLLLLGLACSLALARLPLRAAIRTEGLSLVGVLGAWFLVVLVAPELVPADEIHGTAEGAIAVLVVLATIGIALHVSRRSDAIALIVLAPAFVLQWWYLEPRPRLSLLVALGVLALALLVWLRPPRFLRPRPDGVKTTAATGP